VSGRGRDDSREDRGRGRWGRGRWATIKSLNCIVGTRTGVLKGQRPAPISTSYRVFTRKTRNKTLSKKW
jgi:hypothetical protein